MSFGPFRSWAAFRFVIGTLCAVGFGLRATPAPGLYPGFLGVLALDLFCAWIGLRGLLDLIHPLRVTPTPDGLFVGRGSGSTAIPWENAAIHAEFNTLQDRAAGRFRTLRIEDGSRTRLLRAWTIADREGLMTALRRFRDDRSSWNEEVLG